MQPGERPPFPFSVTEGSHGLPGEHGVPPGLSCYTQAIPPGFKRKNIIFQTVSQISLPRSGCRIVAADTFPAPIPPMMAWATIR